jgi:hypothetical protein
MALANERMRAKHPDVVERVLARAAEFGVKPEESA